jgi:Flp pilus assembly pilin Flp
MVAPRHRSEPTQRRAAPGLAARLWADEQGALAFEWVLLATLLTFGIVSGLSAARDAIIDELGDTAQVLLAIDQSYRVALPLTLVIHAVGTSAASDSEFTDALSFTDCDRPVNDLFGPPLPPEVIGQPPADDFDP